jgi:hypothetical protein
MRLDTKCCITAIAAFSLLLALASIAFAAGSITLTPSTQAAGGSVTVAGTSFGTTKPVAIGVGAEVAGSDANMNYSEVGGSGASGGLNWTGRLSHYPVKPGSFIFTSDTGTGGIVSTYTDRGDGTCTWSYDGSVMGRINYVTGVWYRGTTVDVTGIAALYSATYTYYQYNATPAAGVTTGASGAFSASITVPITLTNGNYNVTAVDTSGNRATATLAVNGVIPEILPIGLIVLLSSVAVIAGSRYSSKRTKSKNPTY